MEYEHDIVMHDHNKVERRDVIASRDPAFLTRAVDVPD